MALADKKYVQIHDKTGADKIKLKDEFDAGHVSRLANTPEEEPIVSALIYQIGLLQEDIEELRRYVAAEITSITSTQASAITANTAKITSPSWVPSSNPSYLTSSSTQSKYLRSDADDYFSGKLNWDGADYADAINMSLGNINDAHYVDANEYRQRLSGMPRNNLGDPTVTEMALFEEQFGPKTTLANDYDDLSDLTFWGQETSSSDWVEITSYSDDQKRRFLRTNNSSIIIPNTYYKFRVEFTAKSYTFANAVYMYWSSQSHNSQVHVWKKRCSDGTWIQHTSATNTISSWPGHGWLPFSNIPWHETNTTSTSHFTHIRVEFTPNWSGHATYGDRNINLYGMQIWGGYPTGRRTPHYYDQNGEFNFLKSAHILDGHNLNIGSGNDLQIYHDGSNSYIKDTGTGTLNISSNQLNLNASNGENAIQINENADVKIRHNNIVKLATTSTGVDVTGNITVTGTVDGVDIGANYANWNTAYGWGNHASAGYLTSSSTQTKYLRSDADDTATGYLALSGGVTGSNSLMTSFFLPQNPEGSHVKSPWFFNDMAYARLRGATITVTVNGGSAPSNAQIDAMFDASTGFWSLSTSGVTSVVVEMTNPPKSMYHGAHYGVTFGNTTWRANSVDIEAYYSSAYQEVVSTTSNSKEFVYGSLNSSGNAVSKIKWTFSNFNTTSMRIVSLFAYNYNATGMPSLYLAKDGGEMYGDIDMGTNTITDTKVGQWDTAYGWGDHASAGYASGDFLLKSGGTMTGNLTINNTYPRIFLTDSNNNDDWSIINNDGKFGIYNDTDTSYALSIDGSNNVGIGTTSPGEKLSVTGNIEINVGATSAQGLIFNENGTQTMGIKYQGGQSGNPIDIFRYQDNTTKVRFLENGNVGIGTTSPSEKLEVVDGAIMLKPNTAGAALTWRESDDGNIGGQLRSYSNRGDIYLYTDGVKTTEISSLDDSFIPRLHVGGTNQASATLQVTGNIDVSGTVDGRDIATDGTKLDTVATNADVTPSWVPSSDPGYGTSNLALGTTSTTALAGDTVTITTAQAAILNNLANLPTRRGASGTFWNNRGMVAVS